jgi:hypothetical protein
MASEKRVTVYWIIPAQPERELLRDIIRILATQFDAPRFEPHLTLGKARESKVSGKTLRAIRSKPLRLKIVGIRQSARFTQTLVVRFAPNNGLNRMVRALGGSKPLRNPHLSLIYKSMPAPARRGLAGAVELPFRYVTFDRIKAVSCISPTATPRDVKKWRVLATKRLSA